MFNVYAQTRYDRVELIGKGEGMNSTVFRSFDPYLQRELAVKEIDKNKFGNDFDSYCQEARTMFAMQDPHVVGIEYVCETTNHVSLALPYFANGSLQARIKDNPLSLFELLKMAQEVIGAWAGYTAVDSCTLTLSLRTFSSMTLSGPLLGTLARVVDCRLVER